MHQISDEDFTGRARLRRAAMRLFAEQGFRGTSVRAVAAAAGVSPSLVTHHFGSKRQLRAAVDEEVLRVVGATLDEVDTTLPPADLIVALGESSARAFGADEEMRRYLRRALLEDSEAGRLLFVRLADGAAAVLDRLRVADVLRPDADREWAPFQLLLFTLGPLLLEPLLPADAFATEVLARRSRANQRLLLHGLLREGATALT